MTKYMKETTKVDQEVPQKEQAPVLTHTALGTFKDDKTGKWCLAEIRYNPSTGETGEFKSVDNEEGGRDAINFRFKIACVEKKLLT